MFRTVVLVFVFEGATSHSRPCSCFSTCSEEDSVTFLNAIPDLVTTKDSPWLDYLHAVYGEEVPVPFNLTQLNFFYHNDASWRRNHPGVEWPMDSCEMERSPAAPGLVVGRVPADSWRCSLEVCSRWQQQESSKERVASVLFWLQPGWHTGASAGVVFAAHGPVGLGREQRMLEANGHVEVMRTGLAREDCRCRDVTDPPAYGCWFYSAVGSGVYLASGKTMYFPKKEQGIAVLRASIAKSGSDAAKLPIVPVHKGDSQLAMLAYALRLETVQTGYSRYNMSEVVATGLGACGLKSVSLIKQPENNPCVPVPLAAGWGASRECICNGAASSLINCYGETQPLGSSACNPQSSALQSQRPRRWCLVRSYGSGFFSHVDQFVLDGIIWCTDLGASPVVRLNDATHRGLSYYVDRPGDDLWAYHFLPTSAAALQRHTPWYVSTKNAVQSPTKEELWEMVYRGARSIFHTWRPNIYGPPYRADHIKANTFDDDWYLRYRVRAHHYIHRYVTVRDEVARRVSSMRDSFLLKTGANDATHHQTSTVVLPRLLCMHMRGTDKRIGKRVDAENYVEAGVEFLSVRCPATIFVASEDTELVKKAQLLLGSSAHVVTSNFARGGFGVAAQRASNVTPREMGVEVLVDALVLSTACDFLLYSTSAVPEFAIQHNLALHARSINLEFASSRDERFSRYLSANASAILVTVDGVSRSHHHNLRRALKSHFVPLCHIYLRPGQPAVCGACALQLADIIFVDVFLTSSKQHATEFIATLIQTCIDQLKFKNTRAQQPVLLWPTLLELPAKIQPRAVVAFTYADCDSLRRQSPGLKCYVAQFAIDPSLRKVKSGNTPVLDAVVVATNRAATVNNCSTANVIIRALTLAGFSVAFLAETSRTALLSVIPPIETTNSSVILHRVLHSVATSSVILCARENTPFLEGFLAEELHYVAFDDAQDLVTKAAYLLQNHALRNQLVAYATAHIKQHHTMVTRAAWIAHIGTQIIRDAQYDQPHLVFGNDSALFHPKM